jgi:hypothetical protein
MKYCIELQHVQDVQDVKYNGEFYAGRCQCPVIHPSAEIPAKETAVQWRTQPYPLHLRLPSTWG